VVADVSAYNLLKFAHIFLSIVAVGFNVSYGVLLGRAAREPEHMGHVLRTVKTLDDRFANPAYFLLLVTGLSMVFVGDLDLTTFWIATSLGIYVALVLVGLLGYTPTLRRQIATLEADGADSPEFRRLSTRGTIIGISLGVAVVIIIFLMVTKPTL
jgi:uncharacterized membrane protein